MSGWADFALAGAPIAGGALLGLAAGNIKSPDLRAAITADMDLLDRLPPEQAERRAQLQRAIDLRVDDIVSTVERNHEIRKVAASYQGNWRDVMVFICAVLFTIVWWDIDHTRRNWTLMFVVLIILSIIAGIYASRGVMRALGTYLRARRLRRKAGSGQ